MSRSVGQKEYKQEVLNVTEPTLHRTRLNPANFSGYTLYTLQLNLALYALPTKLMEKFTTTEILHQRRGSMSELSGTVLKLHI